MTGRSRPRVSPIDTVRRLLSRDGHEVILALGPSRDHTDEIAARLSAGDARVRTVPNPTGRTPAARSSVPLSVS